MTHPDSHTAVKVDPPVPVYVFGDQSYDAVNLLGTLLRVEDAVVRDFIERSTCRITREVAHLGGEQRAGCPQFANLRSLLSPWRAAALNPALSQSLTCLAHIASFLAIHTGTSNVDTDLLNLLHWDRGLAWPAKACVTGICTGLLSAAAISHAASATELVLLGVEAVVVAFRLGATAWDVGSRMVCGSLVDCSGAYRSWAATVISPTLGLIEDAALPPPVFVSARADSHVTLSGTPSALDNFLETLAAGGCVASRLSVYAPYHAAHLFSSEDVERILSGVSAPISSIRQPLPLVSSATGAVISQGTFLDTLRTATEDCLLRTIQSNLVAPVLALHVKSVHGHGHFTVQPIASGGVDRIRQSIQRCLRFTLNGDEDETQTTSHVGHALPLTRRAPARPKIAIVGCSGRFPHAGGMDAFWDLLYQGVDTHEMVPPSRWNAQTHVTDGEPVRNLSGTGFGCWLDNAAAFDARFFNVSPREAPQMDPAQRLALLCAAEAMEDAGLVPGRTPSTQLDRIGVYFGCTSNDWMETNSAQNIDSYFIPGGNRAFIPGRINYHFKFSGPSYSIDTACSSSLAAVQLACNALWSGDVDTAIVGGTNVLTNPDMHAGLDRGHFLSRTGGCKTFDQSADGYCRGEATVVAILKRLKDAVRDHDPLKACIISVATNHSAEAQSITRPHVGAQKALIDHVMIEGGVEAADISYVEMHGTGTQVGDASETNAVLECLAPAGARPRESPLYLGSAKANVGHGEAASGVTSLAKVLLMFEHSTIPPHCGIKTRISPAIPDLESRNARIATTPVIWSRPQNDVRRVLLNNFSAAGGNTALLLEDPPATQDSDASLHASRSHHTVAVSAKNFASLQRNVQNLAAWVERQPTSDIRILPNISYTTMARRLHYPHRIAVVGTNLPDIEAELKRSLEQNDGAKAPRSPPSFIFAFTGQSRSAGIGTDMYSSFTNFRTDIQRYDRICIQKGFSGFRRLFEDTSTQHNATPDLLQLAAVCSQMALFRLWRSFGITPGVVVGHSLGEYPALYAAGVLSQADVIHLVGHRAGLLRTHCNAETHSMLAVRSSKVHIQNVFGPPGETYEFACINGARSVVLGGTKTVLKCMEERLKLLDIATVDIAIPYAFHTAHMEPILEPLGRISRDVSFASPSIPFISPTYGSVATDLTSDYVVRHCRGTVNMHDALHSAREQGLLSAQFCLEIGPEAIVSGMVKEVAECSMEFYSSAQRGVDTWTPFSHALARFHVLGASVEWSAYYDDFPADQTTIGLPLYSWDLKEYWIQYVNDWSLRKGDPSPLQPQPDVLRSSSIHSIVRDTLGEGGDELVVEADLGRPDLHQVVQGHKVWSVPLCTPSIYADIALTIGNHLKQFIAPSERCMIEIASMQIQSALVATSCGPRQSLRTAVVLDRIGRTATCTFSSKVDGSPAVQHAHCMLRAFDPVDACLQWEERASCVPSRVGALQSQAQESDSNTYRFNRSMIYRMVSELAEFHPLYRGLTEITMDNLAFEAIGRVSFKDIHTEGDFHTHPAVIDALSQLGGFVMNANEQNDLNKHVFINHGWENLQIFVPLSRDMSYKTHVRMVEGDSKLWKGDVTVFDEQRELVAVFSGIALQGVPRRLMEHIIRDPKARTMMTSGATSSMDPPAVATSRRISEPASAPDCTSKLFGSKLFGTVLETISEESSIPVSSLNDECCFNDIGVDSLLSLMICSSLRDKLGLDLDNSTFLQIQTIGALKIHLEKLESPQPAAPVPVREDQAIVTWANILRIISEESEVPESDLSDENTCFADIGIDSLLSLVIIDRLRTELGLQMRDSSALVNSDTIGNFKLYVQEQITVHYDALPATLPLSAPRSSSHSIPDFNMTTAPTFVLQGNPVLASCRLFLFPDGCGSATSYMMLPDISDSTAIIAFNSPYLKNPSQMNELPLAQLLKQYIAALRHCQPHGPYHLGGWSAGGILAYAVAQELISSGDEVSTLQLIDSPPPLRGLRLLPQRFFDHCAQVGIFQKELVGHTQVHEPPDWLIPHFRATIDILHDYHALPLGPAHRLPQVTIIWAGLCAFGNLYPSMPSDDLEEEADGIGFLTQQRVDFGPGDWEDLFPGGQIHVHTMEGEHHFSMVRGGGAIKLVDIIRQALGVN